MAQDFGDQLDAFIENEVAEAVREFQVRIGVAALDKIVERTPVDLGMLRANWQVQTGSPDVPILTTADLKMTRGAAGKGGVIAEGTARLAQVKPYETFYIANALPYAEVVEYGGYPNPPKQGSRIRNRDLPSRRRGGVKRALRESGVRYIVKSAGGFSLKAPLGMVRVTAQELNGWEG